jgi:hypothetical protein
MAGSRMDTATAELAAARDEKQDEVRALVERLDAAKADLRRIETALKSLDPAVGQRRDEPDFADKVADLLTSEGPMTKAEISRRIGGPRSRATHALGVLERREQVERTGGSRGRSPEFALNSR